MDRPHVLDRFEAAPSFEYTCGVSSLRIVETAGNYSGFMRDA